MLCYHVQAARTLATNPRDTPLLSEHNDAATKSTDPTHSSLVYRRDLQSSTNSRGWAWYPPQTKVPQDLILANSSLIATLDKIALPDPSGTTRGTIIFTTLRFGDGDQTETMEMINSFCYWLYSARLLNHTMLITTDEATWTEVAAVGHPIFLDRVFPRREAYIDKVLPEGTYNREFDVQKHWWGMRLVELRYKVVYMDSDNFVLQPGFLDPFDEPFDVQGLSDWFEAELWPVGGATEKSCGLYFTIKDERIPRGAMLQEGWHIPANKERLDSANPCQSTGLWYLQPTNLTVQFMRAVVNRIAFQAVWQWDQTAFNEVIMPFLWGMGDQPPLRYRLLPVSKFLNIPVMLERAKSGLPNEDIVVLHAGGLHGGQKKAAFLERQIYRPDFHTPKNDSIFSGIISAAVVSTDTSSGSTSSLVSSGGDGASAAAAAAAAVSGHVIVNTGALHHWQPTNEHTFWMVLYVILAGMALGAALVIGWQTCKGGSSSAGLGSRKGFAGLRRQSSNTSSKRRHAGERSGNNSGAAAVNGSSKILV
ncbi:hypothetical protein NADE_004294 [Nannochloris sp. 'desiccata']|nr:hypothetical protein KSW81_007192 [Chlorella desiccata (nom. nud.)]KAH7621689.1 hypothetical protein NADE_004294 [Chlorella desiccata (nom. nud.)]